jgi:hypothetical protein
MSLLALIIADSAVGTVMRDVLKQKPLILPNIANSEQTDMFLKAVNAGQQVIVFTGSSTMFVAASPHIFDARLQTLTDNPSFSLNVSMTGATSMTSRDLIVGFMLPKGVEAVIYGVEIRAVTSHAVDEAFLDSPLGYVSHLQLGPIHDVLMWLLEHSGLARYRRNLYDLMYGNPSDDNTMDYTDDRGFFDNGPTVWNGDTSKLSSEYLSIVDDPTLRDALGDISGGCKAAHVRCVMVNLPVHRLLNRAISPAVNRTFQQILKSQVIDQGIIVWDLNSEACEPYFGDALFFDDHHMNAAGARQLSTMLADLYASQFMGQKLPANSPARCTQADDSF